MFKHSWQYPPKSSHRRNENVQTKMSTEQCSSCASPSSSSPSSFHHKFRRLKSNWDTSIRIDAPVPIDPVPPNQVISWHSFHHRGKYSSQQGSEYRLSKGSMNSSGSRQQAINANAAAPPTPLSSDLISYCCDIYINLRSTDFSDADVPEYLEFLTCRIFPECPRPSKHGTSHLSHKAPQSNSSDACRNQRRQKDVSENTSERPANADVNVKPSAMQDNTDPSGPTHSVAHDIVYFVSMDLSENKLTCEGVIMLTNWFAQNTSHVRLRDFKIYKNNVADRGAAAISELIMIQPSPLEELHLSHNRISDKGASVLFRSFSHAERKSVGSTSDQNGSATASLARRKLSESSTQNYVYPRIMNAPAMRSAHTVNVLPVWIRLEYNNIVDTQSVLLRWEESCRAIRKFEPYVKLACFAERLNALCGSKDPHCSPARCLRATNGTSPLLHLYSFHHQSASAVNGQPCQIPQQIPCSHSSSGTRHTPKQICRNASRMKGTSNNNTDWSRITNDRRHLSRGNSPGSSNYELKGALSRSEGPEHVKPLTGWVTSSTAKNRADTKAAEHQPAKFHNTKSNSKSNYPDNQGTTNIDRRQSESNDKRRTKGRQRINVTHKVDASFSHPSAFGQINPTTATEDISASTEQSSRTVAMSSISNSRDKSTSAAPALPSGSIDGDPSRLNNLVIEGATSLDDKPQLEAHPSKAASTDIKNASAIDDSQPNNSSVTAICQYNSSVQGPESDLNVTHMYTSKAFSTVQHYEMPSSGVFESHSTDNAQSRRHSRSLKKNDGVAAKAESNSPMIDTSMSPNFQTADNQTYLQKQPCESSHSQKPYTAHQEVIPQKSLLTPQPNGDAEMANNVTEKRRRSSSVASEASVSDHSSSSKVKSYSSSGSGTASSSSFVSLPSLSSNKQSKKLRKPQQSYPRNPAESTQDLRRDQAVACLDAAAVFADAKQVSSCQMITEGFNIQFGRLSAKVSDQDCASDTINNPNNDSLDTLKANLYDGQYAERISKNRMPWTRRNGTNDLYFGVDVAELAPTKKKTGDDKVEGRESASAKVHKNLENRSEFSVGSNLKTTIATNQPSFQSSTLEKNMQPSATSKRQNIPLYIFPDASAFSEMSKLIKDDKTNLFSFPGMVALCEKQVICHNEMTPIRRIIRDGDSSKVEVLDDTQSLILMIVNSVEDGLLSMTENEPFLLEAIINMHHDYMEFLGRHGLVEAIEELDDKLNQEWRYLDESCRQAALLNNVPIDAVRVIDFAFLWAHQLAKMAQLSTSSDEVSTETNYRTLPCDNIKAVKQPFALFVTSNPIVENFFHYIQARQQTTTLEKDNLPQNAQALACMHINTLNKLLRAAYPNLSSMLKSVDCFTRTEKPYLDAQEILSASHVRSIIGEYLAQESRYSDSSTLKIWPNQQNLLDLDSFSNDDEQTGFRGSDQHNVIRDRLSASSIKFWRGPIFGTEATGVEGRNRGNMTTTDDISRTGYLTSNLKPPTSLPDSSTEGILNDRKKSTLHPTFTGADAPCAATSDNASKIGGCGVNDQPFKQDGIQDGSRTLDGNKSLIKSVEDMKRDADFWRNELLRAYHVFDEIVPLLEIASTQNIQHDLYAHVQLILELCRSQKEHVESLMTTT